MIFGEWWLYLVVWVLPLITLTTACHLMRSFVEHAVLTEERPEHDNLLVSITSNPLELAFVAPFNMNFHAEHHIYPGSAGASVCPRSGPLSRTLLSHRD